MQLKIPMHAEILPCEIQSIKLKQPRIAVEYILLENELKVDIPAFEATPDCGVDPVIASYTLNTKGKVPNDLTVEELVWFDVGSKAIMVRY